MKVYFVVVLEIFVVAVFDDVIVAIVNNKYVTGRFTSAEVDRSDGWIVLMVIELAH